MYYTVLPHVFSLIGILCKGALRNISYDYECVVHISGDSEWVEGKYNNLPEKKTMGKTEKEKSCS